MLPTPESDHRAGLHAGYHHTGCRLCPTPDTNTPGAPRTIVVHLNVETPGADRRSADEIADAILAAIEVGQDDDTVRNLVIVAPLAEEL